MSPDLIPTLMLAAGDPLHHNYDYPILTYNGWAVLTNHMLIMIFVTLFMIIMLPKAARRIATGSTGTSHDYVTKGSFAHMFEVICVFLREDVAKPALGDNADKFMPYLWTVFFFILFNNLAGMVPLLDATSLVYKAVAGDSHAAHVEHADGEHAGDALVIDGHADDHADDGHADHDHGDDHAADDHAHDDDTHLAGAGDGHDDHGHHDDATAAAGWRWFYDYTNPGHSHFHGIGGTPTGNIAVTFVLALFAAFVIIGSGIKSLGLGGFIHHLTLDAPVFLWPLTIALEIIGLIAKPFALCVRLFANMTAGHVMLSALLGFCSMGFNGTGPIGGTLISIPSIIFATAIGLLELLVAFIQAYVFTFLTTMFIGMFQHHGHEHDHGHADDHGHAPAAAMAH